MPRSYRKSTALRISEAKNLISLYEEANINHSKSGVFITQILVKLESDRGISKRQRDWFDSLVEEGIPEAKGDIRLLEKIDEAIKIFSQNPDRGWDMSVLLDMKPRVFKGWKLSDKQIALIEKLIKKANEDESGDNIFKPTESQHDDLKNCVALYAGYSRMWRNDRPAVAKAVQKVMSFLKDEGTIEQYHYEKLIKTMGSRLNKFNNPRFTNGDMGKSWSQKLERKVFVLCITVVYIKNGNIVNDWLNPETGIVDSVEQDRISKR
jgi:hypothetical protein